MNNEPLNDLDNTQASTTPETSTPTQEQAPSEPAPSFTPSPSLTPEPSYNHFEQHQTAQPATKPLKQSKPKGKLIGTIVIIILILLLAAAAAFLFLKNNSLSSSNSANTKQIASLNAQLASASAQAATAKTATTTQTATTSSASNIYKLPELGVQFTIPSSLSDLTYAYGAILDTDGTTLYPTVGFSTTADVNAYAKNQECTANPATTTPLGAITKDQGTAPADFSSAELIKQFDGFYIVYSGPQSECSSTQNGNPFQADQKALETALKTMTLIK